MDEATTETRLDKDVVWELGVEAKM